LGEKKLFLALALSPQWRLFVILSLTAINFVEQMALFDKIHGSGGGAGNRQQQESGPPNELQNFGRLLLAPKLSPSRSFGRK
jgi:hypothetical protein